MDRTPGRFLRSVVGWGAVAALVALAAPAAQAAPPPEITAFSPACGPVGTSVAIGGDNFQAATSVEFNGTVATFNVNSSNLITATVPADATTGKIRVVTPDGSATSRDDFTVSASCAPSITSFSPTSGPVGSSVTINGSKFVGTTSVKFNVTSATTFSWNPSGSQLNTTVPSGATTGKIAVTTPAGTATSTQDFAVTSPAPPTITGFSPTSGPVGTVVTINGTNFTGATFVKFATTSATTFTVNSSTRITATVPSGATTGKISVTTPAGTATSPGNFTVTGAPTITSFSPTSGAVGTSVTINGTNFTGATSVKFNNVAASFTVNSSTKITATVPSGATTGKISVTTPAGTATSSGNFTVGPTFHERDISLRLRRHLVARGTVTVSDGFAACYQNVLVRIQRRVGGDWRNIDSTLTDATGFFLERIPDRAGKYRAVVPKVELENEICRRAVSAVVFNA